MFATLHHVPKISLQQVAVKIKSQQLTDFHQPVPMLKTKSSGTHKTQRAPKQLAKAPNRSTHNSSPVSKVGARVRTRDSVQLRRRGITKIPASLKRSTAAPPDSIQGRDLNIRETSKPRARSPSKTRGNCRQKGTKRLSTTKIVKTQRKANMMAARTSLGHRLDDWRGQESVIR